MKVITLKLTFVTADVKFTNSVGTAMKANPPPTNSYTVAIKVRFVTVAPACRHDTRVSLRINRPL